MEINLKTGQVIKIISLIPKAFHATGLTGKLPGSNKSTDIKIYFSDNIKDLENKNFGSLDYVQFKPDNGKSKDSYKPVYNCLDKAYNYCFIETDKPGTSSTEIVLHFEGI
jgi:hypothetical protein